jgi:hypothetical protein
MSSPCTLTGGAFQDSEGNVLALGYLTFRLSQDASVNSSNICSGVEIRIALDVNGNVVGGSEIWGNDVLSPINTYYRVTGYTAAGQPAWGPNNQQVAGASFDLGSWIPNQVISWNPPPSGVQFENNGTPNSSNSVLNLESTDDSVVITDEGGGTLDLKASGGGFTTAGQGWFFGGESYGPITPDTGDFFVADSTVYCIQLKLEVKFVVRSLRAFCITGSAGPGFTAGLFDVAGTTKLIDAGAAAFSTAGSQRLSQVTLGSPVVLQPGIYWFVFGALSGVNGSVISHMATGQWLQNLLNGLDYVNPQTGVTRFGTAANGLSGGGALPSTLGTITAFAEGTTGIPSIPAVMFIV